jgi:hypothetical protein
MSQVQDGHRVALASMLAQSIGSVALSYGKLGTVLQQGPMEESG